MSVFLGHDELRPEIVNLLKGTGLRCAVAFWGTGAASKLFNDLVTWENAKIICDLTMGRTNPAKLRDLGAPNNENLKHLPGLHAKVYISDQGLIVSSANASNNGIGFLDAPRLFEAGVFLTPEADGGTYKQALDWFERIWKEAKTVDESALKCAQDTWERKRAGNYSRGLPRPLILGHCSMQ